MYKTVTSSRYHYQYYISGGGTPRRKNKKMQMSELITLARIKFTYKVSRQFPNQVQSKFQRKIKMANPLRKIKEEVTMIIRFGVPRGKSKSEGNGHFLTLIS